jgi:RNA recognition motif-containing protein
MNIYIANLPYMTDEVGLEQLFRNYGEVEKVNIIKDKETGQSKGYGFVEMSESAGALAIAELDGYDFGGRKLVCKAANNNK